MKNNLILLSERRGINEGKYMEQTMVKPGNKFEILESCRSTDEIDNVLDALGVVENIQKRNEFLMDYMQVMQTYSSDEIDLETQYELTKEVFVEGDWKYMSGKA